MGKKPVETSERQKNERISLAEKRKIINEAEKGVSYALIMSQFKLNSPSVISMIMSRKEKKSSYHLVKLKRAKFIQQ